MKYVENNYSRMQSGWYVMVCWSYLTHGGAQERFTRVPVITDVRDPYFVCHGRSIPERTTLKKDMTDPVF